MIGKGSGYVNGLTIQDSEIVVAALKLDKDCLFCKKW